MMCDFDAQYKRLNAAQREAVDTIEGPVVVVAGPGTGKTQILTLRIAAILARAGAGIGPENILALTFTNAGVMAMRQRLATFIGAADAYHAHIFTFHGFCERQITDHPEYFAQMAFARPIGDVERLDLLARIVRDGALSLLKTFGSDTHYITKIAAAIDQIKNAGHDPATFAAQVETQAQAVTADPESYYKRNGKGFTKGDMKPKAMDHVYKNRELAQVYAAYQEALRDAHLYDFADMIVETVRAVERDETFAAMLREQYQYILVDEHQDTNDGQNRLLDLLLTVPHDGDAPNIFTVGDDKQAIYRFQGASVENFHHFKKRFAQTKVIHLDTNYRATQDLLDTAHGMITRDGADTSHQALTAHTDAVGRARVLQYQTYGDEVRGIVEDMQAAIARGVAPQTIAVFCRSNHEVREIAQMCEKMQVAYAVGGTHNVLDNPLVRMFVRLLAAVAAPMDDAHFAATLVTPLSQVPSREALLFLHTAQMTAARQPLCAVASDSRWMAQHMADDSTVGAFARQLATWHRVSTTMPLVACVEFVARASGWVAFLASRRDHVVQFADLARLVEAIGDVARQHPTFTLTDLLAYFEICATYGVAIATGEPPQVDGVHIMTAHAAKGLEFDHVYIAHAMHGIWGGRKSHNAFTLPINTVTQDDDDERRLFYVALTRARQSVTITRAQYTHTGAAALPTMFLDHVHAHVEEVTPQADARADFAPRLRPVASFVDPHVIRERFLTTPLSVTAMNNYFHAPLLYFFRTIVRLPPAPAKPLLFGNVVHGTLEQFVRSAIAAGTVPSEDEIAAVFYERLRRARVPQMYREEFATHGEKVVRDYYREHAATLPLTGSVEQRIAGVPFVLDDGNEIMLTGAIDKITPTDDGRIVVTDYKTGKSWTEKSKADREKLVRQIRFYKLLLDNDPHATHPPIAYGEIAFIEPRQKTGAYETQRITVTDADVRALTEEINAMARDVMSGAFLDAPIVAPRGRQDKDMHYYMQLLEEMRRSMTEDVV